MLALSTDPVAPAEDASDLFGHPPRKSRLCPACATRAEPYYGDFCFRCVATGDAGRKLGHPTTTEAERDRWSGLNAEIRDGLVPAEPAMFEGED